MTPAAAHKWAFAPRFRRLAFGWRSQPAVQRGREAAVEIRIRPEFPTFPELAR